MQSAKVCFALLLASVVEGAPVDEKAGRFARCKLVHGVGVPDSGPATSSYPEYWGNVEQGLTQCKTTSFIHYDSLSRSFSDPSLIQEVCDFLSDGQDVIDDTLIISHSMGGLVIAYALKNGHCKLGANTKWYASQTPLKGSMLADWVVNQCGLEKEAGMFSTDDPSMGVESMSSTTSNRNLMQRLATEMGFCRSDGSGPNQAYVSLMTSNSKLDGLQDYLFDNAAGAMCGNSPAGLHTSSFYGPALKLIAAITGKTSNSDGVVSIDSCLGSNAKRFTADHSKDFYLASINHVDGTCRLGDGMLWPTSRSPCKWFWSLS